MSFVRGMIIMMMIMIIQYGDADDDDDDNGDDDQIYSSGLINEFRTAIIWVKICSLELFLIVAH